MHLNLTVRNVIAFALFMMLMSEAHEISHFIVGKIACGCWPATRDFNGWTLCKGCDISHYATAAGPIFSMALAWVGMFMLKSPDLRKQSFGFVLIWANVPQARIITVLMHGGDELVVLKKLTANTVLHPHYFLIGVVLVFIMAAPPIIASFMAVKNRFGWLYNVAFMVLPLVFVGSYLFVFMNGLLFKGYLAEPWIMGTPLIITLHTAVVLVVLLAFFRKYLFTLTTHKQAELSAL